MRNLRKGHSGHLSDLKVGQIARVTGIHNDSKVVRRRLLDMGITTGVIVTIKKNSSIRRSCGYRT